MGKLSDWGKMIGLQPRETYPASDEEYPEENDSMGYYDEEDYGAGALPETDKGTGKVVNMSTAAAGGIQLQMVLVLPQRFDEATKIADILNARRTVVLNLERANKDVSRRLIDFLSGVAYANNGSIKRVANGTFVIAPHNVDMSGDLLDELESSGVFTDNP